MLHVYAAVAEEEARAGADAGLRRQGGLLRRHAGARRGPHRRALPPEPGDPPPERLQEQRIRPPHGRRGVRARGGEPHARPARRLALLQRALPRGLRAGVPAVGKARDEIGLGNIAVMVPFCRTPKEADRVLALMAEHGLRRGEGGLRVYVMCEIPSNVVLAEDFAARFDFYPLQRPDAARPQGGPGLRGAAAAARRAGRGGEADDPRRDRPGARRRRHRRDLRRGAEQPPGLRHLPGGVRDRTPSRSTRTASSPPRAASPRRRLREEGGRPP